MRCKCPDGDSRLAQMRTLHVQIRLNECSTMSRLEPYASSGIESGNCDHDALMMVMLRKRGIERTMIGDDQPFPVANYGKSITRLRKRHRSECPKNNHTNVSPRTIVKIMLIHLMTINFVFRLSVLEISVTPAVVIAFTMSDQHQLVTRPTGQHND
jgi:hypothetical protein